MIANYLLGTLDELSQVDLLYSVKSTAVSEHITT